MNNIDGCNHHANYGLTTKNKNNIVRFLSVGILWQHPSHCLCSPFISIEQSCLLYSIIMWCNKPA